MALAGQAMAEELVGQPTPGAIDLQRGVTPLRHDAEWFHNTILLPMCVGISLLVLVLLLICVVRFNRKANPVPARWSHNTKLEVIWTLVPVLILAVIAIFSFRLLIKYHDMPPADVTIKATGNQWNWAYEYPDQKIPEYVSVMLPEDQAKAKGAPFRLAADNPLYVPVNKNVRVLVTGADVIHAFGVPAFGIIIDAIPGRVNETWFRAEKTGVYYGQCRELCGVDHAFMPIEIHVVSQAEFDAWTISKGGMTKAQIAAKAAADAAAAAQAAAAAAAAPAAPAAGAPAAGAAGTPAAATAPATTTTTAAAAGQPAATPAAPAAGQ
jgi:cytochrome c oxidase subunit 2